MQIRPIQTKLRLFHKFQGRTIAELFRNVRKRELTHIITSPKPAMLKNISIFTDFRQPLPTHPPTWPLRSPSRLWLRCERPLVRAQCVRERRTDRCSVFYCPPMADAVRLAPSRMFCSRTVSWFGQRQAWESCPWPAPSPLQLVRELNSRPWCQILGLLMHVNCSLQLLCHCPC